MAAPERFAAAQRVALFTAFAAYVIVGAGVARLYDGPAPDDSVPGNVLDALPTGTTPTIVRLAMAAACVASIPIGLVGCGEILEARIPRCRRLVVRGLVAVAAARVDADMRGREEVSRAVLYERAFSRRARDVTDADE